MIAGAVSGGERRGETKVADRISVLGFAGSLRQGSYNKAALRAAIELAPADMTIETFDLAPIQPYNEDVKQQGFPPPEHEFREKIRAADALLIVTPGVQSRSPGRPQERHRLGIAAARTSRSAASRPRLSAPAPARSARRWPSMSCAATWECSTPSC